MCSSVPRQGLLSFIFPRYTGKVTGLEGPPCEAETLNTFVEAKATSYSAGPSQTRWVEETGALPT